MKKAMIKGSIFLTLFILIIAPINNLFILKLGHRNKLIQGLYGSGDTGYDVVLLGSSHMNGSMDPRVLWNDYGITSFNYATGGQTIDATYYLLKELLKKNKPQVVVVDLYYLGHTGKYGEEGYVRPVIDSMKFSPNKVSAIINCTPRQQWLSYFVPLVKYHSRWKELTEEDYNFNVIKKDNQNGFNAGTEKYGKDIASHSSGIGLGELSPKSAEYLYKIIDLYKKEGFKLVFTNAPYDYSSTEGHSNWNQNPELMFGKIAEIAKDNEIPFINYNDILDEIGFDFKSDMLNIGHVNIYGAEKVTAHLGDFLKGNYDLADHRGNAQDLQWNFSK